MTTVAPALTRVHKLFRHRIIVNNLPDKPFKSDIVSKILVNNKLSKKSILKDSDHMRRGRDHLNDLVSIGLVSTVKTQKGKKYLKNPISKSLKKYRFNQACPKDLYETAFFANCLVRMKLDNPNYKSRTYNKYRCRHIFNLLYLLDGGPLHKSQFHFARSAKKDFKLDLKEYKKFKKIFSKYQKGRPDVEEDFIDSYFHSENEIKEIDRSSIPIIRWLYQAGLVFIDDDNWIHISQKGEKCLKVHSEYYPVWYDDLGFSPDIKAGILIAYNIALHRNRAIDLTTIKGYPLKCLNDLTGEIPFKKGNKQLKFKLCFDIYDSIGPENREEVMKITRNILNKNKMKATFSFPNEFSINTLLNEFKTTKDERKFVDLEKLLGIPLPREESFQNNHEWRSCVQALQLGLNARPYNGEFEGICDLRMAKENPDFIIENSLISLGECKSIKEWGEKLRLDKRVIGEFQSYHEYVEDVNANSVLFVCEAKQLDEDRYLERFIKKSKLDKLVIINNDMLIKLKGHRNRIKKFKSIIKSPYDYGMGERILFEMA